MATYTKRFLPAFALLLGLGACSHHTNPVLEAMSGHSHAPGERPAVAFRFAEQRGGDARLYLLPGLKEATWRFHISGLAVRRGGGFSRDPAEIYLVSGKGDLLGPGLRAGGPRGHESPRHSAARPPPAAAPPARASGTHTHRRPAPQAPAPDLHPRASPAATAAAPV